MKSFVKDERGIAKKVVIIIVAVVIFAGGVGYYFYNKNKNDNSANKDANDAAKQIEANCTNTDKNVCKFLASSAKATSLSSETTSTGPDGKVTKTTFQVSNGNSYVKTEGDSLTYEVIIIGDSTYTKGGDTWWKQTTKPDDTNATNDYKSTYTDDSSKPEEDRTTYKLIGEEACGSLSCYKYQVVDPKATSGETVFVWFDTKDFLLRKQTTEGSTGKSETIYTYDKINISIPSPVKDIPEGQYLIPGQNEPTALPSASGYSQ